MFVCRRLDELIIVWEIANHHKVIEDTLEIYFAHLKQENIINGRKVETRHRTSRVYKGSPAERTKKKKGKEQTTWLLTNLQN